MKDLNYYRKRESENQGRSKRQREGNYKIVWWTMMAASAVIVILFIINLLGWL
tara:strand:- start:744 stop:902 length:159 start_codon:yes stop_codon:yes gene_type:complete